MEKLCSGGLASSMKDVGKTVKSFPTKHVFTTLLLMLLCMLMPQKGWAAVYTYDFSKENDKALSSSSTVDGLAVVDQYPNLAVSSVIQPESGSNHWYIHNGALYLAASGNRNMAILNLRNGDKVTVTFVKNNDNDNTNYDAGNFVSTNAWYNDNGVRKAVTTTDIIESGKEYYMSADGNLRINFHRSIGIKSVSVERNENTPTIAFSESSKTGELINLNFDEPTLSYSPNTATVVFSSSNEKVAKIGNQATGDLMFINTGITTITASLTINGYTVSDSYTVIVSADDATWEVVGTTYRVTGPGKLQDRVVTQVPYITMEFGPTSVVNTTIVRNETTDASGLVATTLDQNGWRQIWPVTANSNPIVPFQGSFYTFKPAVGGTLTYKGYSSRDNTTVLVDATDNYNIKRTYDFTSSTTPITEPGIVVEAGHTYYLYANTPNTNSTNGKSGWSTFQLYSFGFVPSFHFATKAVRVSAGTTTYTQAVTGGSSNTQYEVVTRGEITSASVTSAGEVSFTYGEGKGGAVVVKATDGDLTDYYVITIPYSYATDKTWKMWGSEISKEKLLSNTTDWGVNYEVRSYNSDTRALTYLNNAVMVANSSVNGTNAYYVGETAGLWFRANAKNFGVRMKNYPDGLEGVDQNDASAVDHALQTMLRYSTDVISNPMMVAYGDKATLTIPDVPAGKYIIMKWQSHDASAGEIQTTSGNLTDLQGTAIDTDIKIAKVVTLNEGDAENETAYGTLVFRVATAGDVSFTLNDNGWTELYEITVADAYKSDLNLCNSKGNKIGATNSSIVYDGKASKTVTYKAGPNYARCVRGGTLTFAIVTEGTVQASLTAVKGNDAGSWYDLNLTVTSGVGNVKIIQNVWDNSQKYLLNRLETWIPVGVLETLEYPYTWDFTNENMSLSQQKVSESTVAENLYGSWKATTGDSNSFYTEASQNNMNLTSEKYLFASGSQLTRGTETIAETKGLGIGWSNQLCASDTPNRSQLTSSGLSLSKRGGAVPIVTVPSVAVGSLLYIKADQEPDLVREPTTKTAMEKRADSGSGAYGYEITKAGDIEIRFASAVTIEKIGITNITKSLNDIGYATESRNHAIDHRLTGEFTSNDANAYVVTFGSYNKDKATISKTPVSVVPANTGVVLYKEDSEASVTVPLFYPALNITPLEAENNLFAENMMAANVEYNGNFNSETETISDVSYTRFIMTRTYYTYKNDEFSDSKTSQKEGFYRMIGSKSSSMGANKAYLLVPTASLPTAAWNGSNGAKSGYLMFAEDLEEENGEALGVVQIQSESVGVGNEKTYYTLNGVKLNGKPTASGLYICNGKKVYVK
jgi:hypothetical protein